ncbi:hypothetical protein EAG_06233 [Camponotus floridanus]|uniref:Uncharacterized protein n=1 Tax=Camponotus floridanus TaxID=104421 RepID=E2A619_CAMFO|nr:hypothetical protein EAG_06233 [Camponotus floridanus]
MGRRDDGPTEYMRHRATKRRKKNKKKNKNEEGGRVDERVEVDDRREEEEGVGTSDSNYLELRADDPPGLLGHFKAQIILFEEEEEDVEVIVMKSQVKLRQVFLAMYEETQIGVSNHANLRHK